MLTLLLLLILLVVIIIYIKLNKRKFNENFIMNLSKRSVDKELFSGTNVKENTGFLDKLSKITDPTHKLVQNKVEIYKPETEEKKKNIIPKKETKYIYIIQTKLLKSIYPGDFKYSFYNKDKNNYMILTGNLKNKNEIKVFDINNNVIGGLLYERYNNFIFYLKLLSNEDNNKNINIEFFNNYKNAKIYLDNDDKEFYINKDKINKTLYDIFLFKNKKIGKINGGKVIVYEDYKIYLNAFGLAYILFENY